MNENDPSLIPCYPPDVLPPEIDIGLLHNPNEFALARIIMI